MSDMFNRIKYPVRESYPDDAQASINDLEDQGFREETGAMVMRHADDPNTLYILIKDHEKGRSWLPLRLDR